MVGQQQRSRGAVDAQQVLASREASSMQQEAAGNRQYAAAVSVAPVAVAVRAALTADTVATEDLTAHWVTLVRIWAVSVPAAVRWEVAVAMVAHP